MKVRLIKLELIRLVSVNRGEFFQIFRMDKIKENGRCGQSYGNNMCDFAFFKHANCMDINKYKERSICIDLRTHHRLTDNCTHIFH